MRVSLKWLREYVDFDLTPEDLAHRLTMAGIEAGGIERVGASWENVVVGRVVKLEPHPNADRLRLATVNLGAEEMTVVCGAPNVAEGQRIAFARVGATLTDPHTGDVEKLRAAKIRGVLSQGMVCSPRELGMGEDHSGILVLPPDAPVGAPLFDYMGDTILDLEVTANRPDCLSMLGVAWEVAAITGNPVRMPPLDYPETQDATSRHASVDIQAPDLCQRYTASLISGLKVAPSPRWMQERLTAAGLRPINNLVDVTNYVLLEFGQPLHAFDYTNLAQGRVIVRRARNGEAMSTLDGERRELSSQDLVIADSEKAVGLAGIMGGAGSEVSDATSTVLLESANFHFGAIRRSSAILKVRTESSLRFEKGLNPELAEKALRRATRLLVELGGGKAHQGILDSYPGQKAPVPIRLDSTKVERVLGVPFSQQQMLDVFKSLGLVAVPSGRDAVLVEAPFWRSDISIPEDLVEEIARTVGYDSIPTTLPGGAAPARAPDPVRSLREDLRESMVNVGAQEIVNYTLVSKDLLESVAPEGTPAPLHVWNPMSAEQEFFRTTLRGGLLRVLALNQRLSDTGLHLFEMGRVYHPRPNDLPEEVETLAAIFGGPRQGLSWQREEGNLDFFDAKGVLEAILERQGVQPTFRAVAQKGLHPGRTAEVLVGGQPVGVIGEAHPDLLKAFDIDVKPVTLFEIDLAKVAPHVRTIVQYVPATRYPGNVRDIALVVDESVPTGDVETILRTFPSITRVTLFDIYRGANIPAGKKSLAFRVVYQSPTRTLTDKEVDIAQIQLLAKLQQQVGAVLRG